MKTISSIGVLLLCVTFLLSLCACSSKGQHPIDENEPPKEYSNEVQVVLLLGQSNAEGHTNSSYLVKTVGEEKAAEYAKGYDNVNISYACTVSANTSDGKFVPVKLGQGTATSKFGPEVGIAEKISALDLAKRVYVIKYAYGGTTLTTQWRSPSSKNTGGLYTGAVQYVNEQLKNSKSKTCIPSSRLYAGCRASRTPAELVTILTRNWSATSSKIYAKNLRFISRPIPR